MRLKGPLKMTIASAGTEHGSKVLELPLDRSAKINKMNSTYIQPPLNALQGYLTTLCFV